MAGIQANTGLVTGIDIQGTVDKLIALQAQPRDVATARLKALKDKQTAVADLTASVIAIQLAAKNLSKTALFSQTTVSSANTSLLAAAIAPGGTPAPGNYQFTPVRMASAQHVLSQGFASKTTALGAGTLTIRQGGSLASSPSLSTLNGGTGVERGKIRITDRSGTTAVIDLRYAQTVDDVLQAINSNETINVTASAAGDKIQLVDNTGETTANLRVQEVGTGRTAADMGLSSINVAASTAQGQDIIRLYDAIPLSRLNDGNGVNFNSALPDLQVTFRDGSSPLQIDFQKLAQPADFAEATTGAATGINADLRFVAKQSGETLDGVTIQFIDSGTVTAGSETVVYDSNAKTLTFDIDAGATTANDIIAALDDDPTASALFVASAASGGDGTGLITLTDTATTSGGAAIPAGDEQTLGDLLETINAADPTRLQAQLSADGDRIELIDLTTPGAGTFAVTSLHGGTIVEELGLTNTASGGTISGRRLLGGLDSTLLSSLNGGQGLGTLGSINLTDRSGASATINLASAETVDDVLAAINNAGLGLEAELNSSGNGISITDTTGATTSNLIIADGDGTASATKLGLAVNAATTQASSGDLHKQTINRQTLLSSYNQGQGVRLGSFTIKDSNGAESGVNLTTLGAETVGDVIDAINGLSIGVEARINETGDGILLLDTAGGTGTLTVTEVGSGKAATDLKIAGESVDATIDGQPESVIDGSTAVRITLDADDTLEDLVSKLNATSAGLNASIFNDGTASPYRLAIANSKTGAANSWTFEGSGLGLQFEEISSAQDALVSVGSGGVGAPTLLMSSSTNVVDNAVAGIRVTLTGTSTEPINVTVKEDVAGISSRVKAFVDQYNKLVEKLGKLDFYNSETEQAGVLFSSHETLRIRSDLSGLLSGRFSGSEVRSLAEVGVSFNQDGTLAYDESKFNAAYADRPEEIEQFFTDEDTGFGKRLDDVVEGLAGIDNSVLINRTVALQSQVDQLSGRIEFLNLQLDKSKERLLMQFYRLETTVGKLQNSFGAIEGALANAMSLYSNL